MAWSGDGTVIATGGSDKTVGPYVTLSVSARAQMSKSASMHLVLFHGDDNCSRSNNIDVANRCPVPIDVANRLAVSNYMC